MSDIKTSFFINVFLSICLSSVIIATNGRNKLIIDHDGGADDSMAIFVALLYEKYFDGPEVIALTTTHGNVNETQAYENTQRILGVANRKDIPIYRGAVSSLVHAVPSDGFFGHDGLGDLKNVSYKAIQAKEEHAALALIKLSKKFKGNLTVVTIGTLTNIALAVKLDPDFIKRLDQLVIGAGNIKGKDNPDPEFNALLDVEAYKIAVNNSYPDKVTVLPFSQNIESINVSKEWRVEVLGAIDSDILKVQNQYESISLSKQTRWYFLDPSVIAVAIKHDLVKEYKFSQNDIILCGASQGVNTNSFVDENHANVRIVYWVNSDDYKQFLIDVFSADANKISD